jgi:hypothetical protein
MYSPAPFAQGMTMHGPTAYDLWLTTDPREREAAAWDAYADAYHDRAEQLVLAQLTETVPTRDVNATDRTALLAALAAVVRAQDTEMITAWASEISDEIPSFETWAHPERAA